MNAFRWFSALLLALAVVAGAAWWLQRESAAQLRGEVELLRDESRRFAALRAENAKLRAAQPADAELARLRSDRAAVVQLRAEINALNDSLQKRESALTAVPKLIDRSNPEATSPLPPALTLTFDVSRDGRLSSEGKSVNVEALKQRLNQMARGERVSFKIRQPKIEAGQSDTMMREAEGVFDMLKETVKARGLKMTM